MAQAGTLMVSGTGGQGYSVFDASGKERLTYDRPTNSATELVAGTYTVVLNESRQRIEVPAGKETVVRAGTLMVSGTSGQGYSVWDASGKERLTYDRHINSITELLPGMYMIKVGERKLHRICQGGRPSDRNSLNGRHSPRTRRDTRRRRGHSRQRDDGSHIEE